MALPNMEDHREVWHAINRLSTLVDRMHEHGLLQTDKRMWYDYIPWQFCDKDDVKYRTEGFKGDALTTHASEATLSVDDYQAIIAACHVRIAAVRKTFQEAHGKEKAAAAAEKAEQNALDQMNALKAQVESEETEVKNAESHVTQVSTGKDDKAKAAASSKLAAAQAKLASLKDKLAQAQARYEAAKSAATTAKQANSESQKALGV